MLVEGAGSASEINLRRNDIANMGFARACGRPRRAGRRHRSRWRFRATRRNESRHRSRRCGDDLRVHRQSFSRRSHAFHGWHGAHRRANGLASARPRAAFRGGRAPAGGRCAGARSCARQNAGSRTIVIPVLPHIANFDDFDPLDREDDLTVLRVRTGPLPVCDCIILPGSKATLADLAAFRANGWDIDLLAHVRRGGRVIGICGGYQMLGRAIARSAWHRRAARRGVRSRAARCRNRADIGQATACRFRTFRRGQRALQWLRNARRRDGRPRQRATGAAVRGRTRGRRDLARRARDRPLCAWPVQRRRAAPRVRRMARRKTVVLRL